MSITMLTNPFDTFKSLYPARNGRKLEMPLAKKKWSQYIKPDDVPSILSATRAFANSKEVQAGIGIMNAHRFIRDGKGIEHWRDWCKGTIASDIVKPERSEPLTPERIKDIKMRFSDDFQYKLKLRLSKLWEQSKRPRNMSV